MKKFILVILLFIIAFPVKASFSDNKFYSYQNYLGKIGYSEFISNISMGEDVVVAIIDDGVWLQHPDLSGSTWINSDEINYNGKDDDNNGYVDDYYGWNFIDDNYDLTTKGSHGTGVAGLISANNNNKGIVGVAAESKIMSLTVCDYYGCNIDNVSDAILYAADNGADIINLSLGASGYLGYSAEYNKAIEYAYNKDVVIVASAGNGDVESAGTSGQDLNFSKASPVSNDVNGINMVLGVGALSTPGINRTSWSNYGKGVELYTPGEQIATLTVPAYDEDGASYAYMSGTSFSAPLVAGAAALLKSKYPELKNWEIIDRLIYKSTLDIEDVFRGQKERCIINSVSKSTLVKGEEITIYGNHMSSNSNLYLKKSGESFSLQLDKYINFLDASNFTLNTSLLPIDDGSYTFESIDDVCRIDYTYFTITGSQVKEVNSDNSSDSTLIQPKNSVSSFIDQEKSLSSVIDNQLTEKLKGRILLQVEDHGEAWYVEPKTSKRYYMANGSEAYNIMRNLGVGITNKDLEKVKTNQSFAKQHSGKIFLQVENYGEAYYIDVDGNAHYLKDGNEAYNIIRELGLGITNNDLRKIDMN